MPVFGSVSRSNLLQVDPRLIRVANKVILAWDCTVIDGVRTVEEQRKNLAKGVSKTMASKHLPQPPGNLSHALDVMPWPLNWGTIQKGYDAIKRIEGSMAILEAYAFAGFFDGVAFEQGVNLRSGYDWNTNRQFEDQTFLDLPHHELRG